jgi:hypothetical protein
MSRAARLLRPRKIVYGDIGLTRVYDRAAGA